MRYNLPVNYNNLHYRERRLVRLQYIEEQNGKCYYCGEDLDKPAPERITSKPINWRYFPDNFLQIFNRNGHLVYEKSGYHNEWDGKYYGNDLPAATYYFVLDLKEDRIIKGDITIIR